MALFQYKMKFLKHGNKFVGVVVSEPVDKPWGYHWQDP